MAPKTLNVEIANHIATVTFDNPPVNAVNRQVLQDIFDVFSEVGKDTDVRAVIFAAACERAFCAGQDLNEMGNMRDTPEPVPLPGADIRAGARDAMWAILDCPVPVIAAVNAAALGAGIAFVACCDIIVASERATFGCPEVEVGLLGTGSHLQRMVGPYRMREMFYTARRVPAEEMYHMGAISKVVPPDALMEEARAIAESIAIKSPAAIRLAKESLNRVEYLPLKEAYRTEQDYTARLGRYDDSREAIRAFVEHREPNFKGR